VFVAYVQLQFLSISLSLILRYFIILGFHYTCEYISMDFTNELMSVVYGSNKLVANRTIQTSFSVSPSTSSIVPGESSSPCWQLKHIIIINKLVDPEEGTSNSIVQQAPPMNYYESDPMKLTITTFKKTY
jgi:hypothetical protein